MNAVKISFFTTCLLVSSNIICSSQAIDKKDNITNPAVQAIDESQNPITVESANTRGVEGSDLNFKCNDGSAVADNTVVDHPMAKNLTKSSIDQASQENEDATNPPLHESVYWLYTVNKTAYITIQELNNSQIFSGNGWLNFTNLTLDVAGNYICKNVGDENGHSFNKTIQLVVYKKYLLFSFIIMGLNVALILLFSGCMIFHTIRSRVVSRKGRQKEGKKSGADYVKVENANDNKNQV